MEFSLALHKVEKMTNVRYLFIVLSVLLFTLCKAQLQLCRRCLNEQASWSKLFAEFTLFFLCLQHQYFTRYNDNIIGAAKITTPYLFNMLSFCHVFSHTSILLMQQVIFYQCTVLVLQRLLAPIYYRGTLQLHRQGKKCETADQTIKFRRFF